MGEKVYHAFDVYSLLSLLKKTQYFIKYLKSMCQRLRLGGGG